MPSRRRPHVLWFLLVAVVAVVGLGVLALGFRSAPAHAEAARTELQAARAALEAEDVPAAQAAVARARTETDDLQDSVQGVGGDLWSWVPVAGGAVRDVRRLGNALDEMVAVAETGVALLPEVQGQDSTLLEDGNVDLDALEQVITQLRSVSDRLEVARGELADVADTRPLVGGRLGDARDTAMDEVEPLTETLDAIEPLLEVLPRVLGASADRQYLVALLNPAEQRFSGGTPLTFVTMNFDRGQLSMGETVDPSIAPGAAQPLYWKKVKGNRFHRGRLKVLTSTMAPDWSVSGNELANAWRSLRGRRLSGVVVIDVVALADLISLTGPIDVPGLGRLDGDSLVEKLVGSYDEYPDPAQRKAVNRALAPVFTQRLLSTADPVATGEVLARAADERRFAVYFRNAEEQAAFDAMGLTGTLGPADRDYLGVFTQNAVPSKSDYWHRRGVRSEVAVREDGSAHVRLTVSIHNDSPPYLQPEPDPRDGYFTRWSFLSVLTMLPEGTEFTGGTVDGRPFPIQRSIFYGRTFQRHSLQLPPQARREMVVEYDVPAAASVGADGSLAYGLAIDPQGLVVPQATRVDVRFPRGFTVADVPAEWQRVGPRAASYRTDGLETSEVFEVVAHP